MPMYGYECECGESFSELCRIGEAPEKMKCPKCDKEAGRVITGISFVLKGSGWSSNTSKMNEHMLGNRQKVEKKAKGRPPCATPQWDTRAPLI